MVCNIAVNLGAIWSWYMVYTHKHAAVPTAPDYLRVGLGKHTQNTRRLKSGDKGEENSVNKTIMTNTNGKRITLTMHKLMGVF